VSGEVNTPTCENPGIRNAAKSSSLKNWKSHLASWKTDERERAMA